MHEMYWGFRSVVGSAGLGVGLYESVCDTFALQGEL